MSGVKSSSSRVFMWRAEVTIRVDET